MQPPTDTQAPVEQPKTGWRDVWAVPAMVLAMGLIILGGVKLLATSPQPDFEALLARGEKLVEHGEYERAIAGLNTNIHPFLTTGKLSPEQRARFHLSIARSLYLAQRDLGLDRDDNNRNIVASFLEAESLGTRLAPPDISALAHTLASLGELDKAKARADALPSAERARRTLIFRDLIERASAPAMNRELLALGLLAELLADPQVEADARCWALSRQAELQLARGSGEDVISRLLRELPRLDGVPREASAELQLLLGQAYLQTRGVDEAARMLAAAGDAIRPEHAMWTRLRALQGRAEAIRGNHAAARGFFESAITSTTPARWRAAALLGLAESASALSDHEASFTAYERLAEQLREHGAQGEVTNAFAAESLSRRADERAEASKPEDALRLASLAESLMPGDKTPVQTLWRLARTHRQLADAILTPLLSSREGVIALVDLDAATRAEVRGHLVSAGAYFRRHADKSVLTDPDMWAASVWAAADAFDRAGDQEQAIQLFQTYLAERTGDPRQPEARYRLAQAFQARGDFETAAKHYGELVLSRGTTEGSGPWADASEVPLAQCFLADSSPDNDTEAEQRLIRVVSGTLGGPSTRAYRDAVFELGTFYYRTGNSARAIERLDEALTRYPEDPRSVPARFKLADALRQSSAEIDKALSSEAMPAAQRISYQQARTERLRRAIGLFDQVRRDLDSKEPRRRTAIEELYLRNSYFYLGECAYSLADWEAAVAFYNAAHDRYSGEPASLVAMTQIVSCHVKQGDIRRARAANERAKRFFASMPAGVWDDPNLPMTRSDWERWLQATSQLWDQKEPAQASAPESNP